MLLTGGARSGKSRYALHLCDQQASASKVLIATATAGDAEMARRIEIHRQERSPDWRTVEEPLDLAGAIRQSDQPGQVTLVDCLTLWTSNWLLRSNSDDSVDGPKRVAQWQDQQQQLIDALQGCRGMVVMVTNEVGMGLVPPTPLGRQFRDWAGAINQRVAACSDHVVLMVSGIPMAVRGELPCA